MTDTKALVRGFEVKTIDATGEFEGHGSVFDVLDSYRDIVVRGAFTDSLKSHAAAGTLPLLLYGHDTGQEIGEWLEMREDERGLYCRGRLWIDGEHPDPMALRAYRGMKKANGRAGLSIGYRTLRDEYERETSVRKLLEVSLFEVSVVTLPANTAARVTGVKSETPQTIRDFETFLRDEGGFSHQAAKSIAATGFKAAQTSEPRDEDGALNDLLNSLREARQSLPHPTR